MHCRWEKGWINGLFECERVPEWIGMLEVEKLGQNLLSPTAAVLSFKCITTINPLTRGDLVNDMRKLNDLLLRVRGGH